MARTRKPRYTESISIRKHDLSVEDREERQKALIPEANLVCLKERCWLHGRLCKPKKEKCDAYF
jgi:hypothetical protein